MFGIEMGTAINMKKKGMFFSGDALYKNRFGQIVDYKESVEKNIIS